MSQRILVPLDGSPLAELALSEALAWTALPNSTVILLQVIPPIENVIADGEITIDQQWDIRQARAHEYLRSVAQRPDWRGVKCEIVVRMGNPAQVILETARDNKVDRIVIASHGRTGVGRWVYGSVAAKVLEAADRTVVLVRAGSPKQG